MAVPQSESGARATMSKPANEDGQGESIGRHLRRIAITASWAVAPVVAVLLMLGRFHLALSVVGGGLVSVMVFASLRVMVYKGLGVVASQPGSRPEPPGPAALAMFAVGSFAKMILAIAVVFGLMKLGASPLWLLGGFVIAQIAIAVSVSRGLKGPV